MLGSDGLVDDMISPKKTSATKVCPDDMKDIFKNISDSNCFPFGHS